MKILKPGKVEQRTFVCKRCECVFLASQYEAIVAYSVDEDYVHCPTCSISQKWNSGEPYEEPTPTQTDRERLELIRLIKNFRACGLETADCEADFLIANGVTFREG